MFVLVEITFVIQKNYVDKKVMLGCEYESFVLKKK
jgi:hypothetical protein